MDTQRRFEVLKDLFEANKKSVALMDLLSFNRSYLNTTSRL